MNKPQIGLLVAIIGITFSTAVFADASATYFGVDVASFSKNIPGPATGTVTRQVGSGYRLLWGNKISKIFAVEAEAVDFGKKSNFSTVGVTFAGIGMSGVAIVPLKNDFSIYLKMGIATTSASDATTSNSTWFPYKIAPTFGIGLQFEVNPDIAFRVSANTYFVSSKTPGLSGNNNTNVDSVGMLFRF